MRVNLAPMSIPTIIEQGFYSLYKKQQTSTRSFNIQKFPQIVDDEIKFSSKIILFSLACLNNIVAQAFFSIWTNISWLL